MRRKTTSTQQSDYGERANVEVSLHRRAAQLERRKPAGDVKDKDLRQSVSWLLSRDALPFCRFLIDDSGADAVEVAAR